MRIGAPRDAEFLLRLGAFQNSAVPLGSNGRRCTRVGTRGHKVPLLSANRGDRPTLCYQESGFRSFQIEHVARLASAQIDVVDHLGEFLD